MEPKHEYQVTFRINMDSIPGGLQVRLQWFINMVAFGLQASNGFDSARLALPDVRIAMKLSGDADAWDVTQVRKAFANWMLACGLRELIEEFSGALAQSREILAAWSLGSGDIPSDDWNRRMVTEAEKFQRLGFPDKISFLGQEYAVELPPDKEEDLLSINRARNCLVHRSGIVGLPDIPVTKDQFTAAVQARRELNPTEKWTNEQVVAALSDAGLKPALEVRWLRIEVVSEKDGAQTVLGPGSRIEGGSLVGIRIVRQTKSFSFGQLVRISADEFSEIAYSLLNTSIALRDAVEARGRAMGVEFEEKAKPNAC